jgi:fucose 4-O-acetylase-like acetyltransferase
MEHAAHGMGAPLTGSAGFAGVARAQAGSRTRTAFIDNLKVFLTVLVVLHHAGQPYGPTGGAWPLFHAEKFRLLGPFFHINASFFMGLFFLISGYYLKAAYDRKGARQFLGERLRRFGVPILVFGWGFMPLARHFVEGKAWADCFFPFQWAHLWFLGHLLVYATLYTAFRLWTDRGRSPSATAGAADEPAFPSQGLLLGYALLLAVASVIVRIWYPIDLWVQWGVPAELAHLPQYASLFVFGIVAGNFGWLERIPDRTGRPALAMGLVLAALRFCYTLFHWGFLGGDEFWIDFAWCLWEALLCTGLCVGLCWFFHAHLRHAGRGPQFLARHAFAVYVIHLPILVFLQMAMEHTTLGPLTLTLVTGVAAVLICYAVAALYGRALDIVSGVLATRQLLARRGGAGR